MNTSKLSFSLLTLSTMALIVACSNNNGKLGVTPTGPRTEDVSMNSCVDSLSYSTQTKVTGKGSVVLCEVPSDSKDGKPVAIKHDISYSVGKVQTTGSSRASLALSMSLGLTNSQSPAPADDKQKELRAILVATCGGLTKKIFERSQVQGAPMTFTLNADFGKDDPFGGTAEGFDQIMHVSLTTETGGDYYWTLDSIPTRPRFYPMGTIADMNACAAQFPDKGTSYLRCRYDKRATLNLSACAAIAHRVGSVMGLVDDETEAKTCGAVQPQTLDTTTETPIDPSASPKPTPTDEEVAKFLNGGIDAAEIKPGPTTPDHRDSSFSKPRQGDAEFLKSSTLNRKDVVSLVSPVCKDVK